MQSATLQHWCSTPHSFANHLRVSCRTLKLALCAASKQCRGVATCARQKCCTFRSGQKEDTSNTVYKYREPARFVSMRWDRLLDLWHSRRRADWWNTVLAASAQHMKRDAGACSRLWCSTRCLKQSQTVSRRCLQPTEIRSGPICLNSIWLCLTSKPGSFVLIMPNVLFFGA